MTQTLRKCPDAFAETEIDDEVVLMDLSSGDFFSIKDSGLEIWNLLDQGLDRASLLAQLEQAYGVPRAELAGDVDAFLDQVMAAGFVTAG
ncbi:HPr-rel-A system PqqD family peptide chaperone [Novosphingobium sp. B 225]|uniref:HPr-rel-A system PqqD family peptide chaperone n=1 Tax=Novosphingobium sp. B 225 TaxID=1961849 RepID=UPI000B4AA6CF|nr:HPr-rel-A system PqqD family peptide chaperone [Novosphingobium sp. B 225]